MAILESGGGWWQTERNYRLGTRKRGETVQQKNSKNSWRWSTVAISAMRPYFSRSRQQYFRAHVLHDRAGRTGGKCSVAFLLVGDA